MQDLVLLTLPVSSVRVPCLFRGQLQHVLLRCCVY
eukprot:SAG22_NODE_23_length_31399_cov_35.631313_8_plen_35_part_00